MRLPLRARLFSWLLPRLPGGTIVGASAETIARIQDRGVPTTPVTRTVLHHPLRSVIIDERPVQGAAGALPARLYRPTVSSGPLPLILNLHGGGWVRRDLEVGDWLLSRIAGAVPASVVSVDYRLAPVHPFPAAVEDAIAAAEWIAEHPDQYGGEPGGRIAIMGDSAGGNLAAVTALLARDRGSPRLDCQILLYPPTDLTGTSPSLTEAEQAPILSYEAATTFRNLYLGDADPADPRASPLLSADHSGLPPTLIQVGDRDPLRDDARRYAAALRAAGVAVRGTVYLGAMHGFLSFPGIMPAARQAAWEIINELRLHLHPLG